VEEMIRYLTSRASALSVCGTLWFAIRAESLRITSDSTLGGRSGAKRKRRMSSP
jgi:hypothetical protein